MAVRPEIKRSERAIRSTLERLKAQVRTAKGQRFPGDHPGPRLFLALVEGFIDTGQLYLSDLSDREVGATPEDVLREAADVTADAYYYLSEMAGASIQDLPYPIVPALQRWFSDVGVVNTIFFRAKLEDNYELRLFTEDDLPEKKRLNSLSRAISNINWPLMRVSVPSRAFSYLPHMAIVAHEIGHAIYKNLSMQQINLAGSGVEAAIAQRLKRVPDIDSLSPVNIAKHIGEITDYWIQELTADAVSCLLAGPAAFFALSELFSYRANEFGYSRYYPPNSLRRKVLHEQLIGRGFGKIFKKRTGATLTVDFNSPLLIVTPDADWIFELQIRTGKHDPRLAAIYAELPGHILSLIPSIYGAVSDHLSKVAPASIYTAEKLDNDLRDHLGALLLALPPIEADGNGSTVRVARYGAIDHKLNAKKPVDFASILNIGWAALLTKHSELRIKPTGAYNADYEKMEKIHSLLLKAVELSEALRSWRAGGGLNGGLVWEGDQASPSP